MHGTAKSLIEAVFARKRFAHHTIEQEVNGDFLDGLAAILNDGERAPAKESFHDLHELCIIQNLDGAQAFCDDFAMAAMGAKGEVVQCEFIRRADIRRFLTDAKMRRAGVVILHAAIFVGGFNQVEHGLKLADIGHVPIDIQKLIFGEVLFLILHGLLILVDRNRRERKRFGFSNDVRIDKNLFRHCSSPSIFKQVN